MQKLLLVDGGQAYFCKAVIDHFWCHESWCTGKLFCEIIMIEVHSVKSELPKSSIVNTYIEDQLKVTFVL